MDAALDDAAFDALARRVFTCQFERSAIYRGYCEARGVTPDRVAGWRQIPAVPTAAFKEVPLTTFPPETAVAVFHTSGTTQGGRPGRHYFPTLRLYEASLRPAFAAFVLSAGCEKTGEGEYEVQKPVIGSETDTVETPSVETGSVKDTLNVPDVDVNTEKKEVTVPKVDVETPSEREQGE